MKAVLSRSTELSKIIDKIQNELPKPISVVVFGVPNDFRASVIAEITNRCDGIVPGFGGSGRPVRDARYELVSNRNILAVMDGYSGRKEKRTGISLALKGSGARTVVGVYVVSNDESDTINASIVKALKKNPPSADEFDYLVTIDRPSE